MHRYVLALFIIAAFFLALPQPARADTASDTAWNAAYDAVLKNPTNRDLNKNYLSLCIAREDYEAAIAPLERLLAQSPDDANLIFKLGQMFHQLHSDKVAQTYFKKVADAPTASTELKAQAASLIQNQQQE